MAVRRIYTAGFVEIEDMHAWKVIPPPRTFNTAP
jgi:hypothetical protein